MILPSSPIDSRADVEASPSEQVTQNQSMAMDLNQVFDS